MNRVRAEKEPVDAERNELETRFSSAKDHAPEENLVDVVLWMVAEEQKTQPEDALERGHTRHQTLNAKAQRH